MLFADLMADHTADGCATDSPDRTATRKDGSSNRTDTCADGSIFVLRRHSGTSTQADQHDYGKRTERESAYIFHGMTSLSKKWFRVFRLGV